jgi:hypothetical protein
MDQEKSTTLGRHKKEKPLQIQWSFCLGLFDTQTAAVHG